MKHFCGTVELTSDIIISPLQAKQNYLKPLPINHNSDTLNQFKCLPLSTFPASPWMIITASAWTPSWEGWKSWWTRYCEYAQHRNNSEISDLSGKHCGWQTAMCDRTLSRCCNISDVFNFFSSFYQQQPKSQHICISSSQLGFNFQNHNSSMIFFFSTSWTSSNTTTKAHSLKGEMQSSILVTVMFLLQYCVVSY